MHYLPSRFSDRHAHLLMVILVALLFLGAPHGGAFYWSDSPRHALNGVFVADLLTTLPIQDPSGFAYAYYAKYPALTILFYPPLFYVFSAPFFLLLGVSHESALTPVFVLYVLFVAGSYQLFRYWMSAGLAFSAATALAFSPEIAFWGRQVMLEVPAFAALTWSAVFFTRYRKGSRNEHLYLSALLLVCAMYVKITAGFMAGVFLIAIMITDCRVLRCKQFWLTFALSAIALVPLVFLTIKFGQANVQSVAGIADAEVSRRSLSGWIWYAKQLPGQLGWPLVAGALAFALAVLAGRGHVPRDRGDVAFWVGWLLIGYVFFSAIDLKEARHTVFILPPLVFAAFMLLGQMTRWPGLFGGLLALAVAAETIFLRPVYYVDGYADAARYIATHAPKESAVVFSGYRDGSFIFNMRARQDRPDLSVVRADKLLLRVAVRRELGVEQKSFDESEIVAMIDRLGAHYVVAQPGFWNDLAVMQRFERVLSSAHFEKVATIQTPANYPAHESALSIYRNRGNVAAKAGRVDIDLPMINRSIAAPLSGSKQR